MKIKMSNARLLLRKAGKMVLFLLGNASEAVFIYFFIAKI